MGTKNRMKFSCSTFLFKMIRVFPLRHCEIHLQLQYRALHLEEAYALHFVVVVSVCFFVWEWEWGLSNLFVFQTDSFYCKNRNYRCLITSYDRNIIMILILDIASDKNIPNCNLMIQDLSHIVID